MVPPGLSLPSASAASIIASPIRSLFEPPGLRNSSLASSVAPVSEPKFGSRTIGVLPISSRTVGYAGGIRDSVTVRRTGDEGPPIVPVTGPTARGFPESTIGTPTDGAPAPSTYARAVTSNPSSGHVKLCTIELIAEGHAERCPGEPCAFWAEGCVLERVEAELDSRPEVAALLLELRRTVDEGREVSTDEARDRFDAILDESGPASGATELV